MTWAAAPASSRPSARLRLRRVELVGASIGSGNSRIPFGRGGGWVLVLWFAGSGGGRGGLWGGREGSGGGHGGRKGPPGRPGAGVRGLAGAICQRDRSVMRWAYIETILLPETPKRYSPATDNPEHLENPEYLRCRTINPGNPYPGSLGTPIAGG